MMSNLNRPKNDNEIFDNNETLSVATIKAGNRSEKKVTWRDHQGKEPQEMAGISSGSLKREMDKQFEKLIWPLFIAPLLEPISDGQSDTRTTLFHGLWTTTSTLGTGFSNLEHSSRTLTDFYSRNGMAVTPALSEAIKAFCQFAGTKSNLVLHRLLQAHKTRNWIGDNDSISVSSSATPPSVSDISRGHYAIHHTATGILLSAAFVEGLEEIHEVVLRSTRLEWTDGSPLEFNAEELMDSQASRVTGPQQGSGALTRRDSL